MKVPELADLPFAAELDPHEGNLSPEGDYDTVLFERAEFEAPSAPNARFLECALRQVSITTGGVAVADLRHGLIRDARVTGTWRARSRWLELELVGTARLRREGLGERLRELCHDG